MPAICTEYKPVVWLGEAVAIVDFLIHATSVRPSRKYNRYVTDRNLKS